MGRRKPEKVLDMDGLRVVDLTRPIIPGKMNGRRCEVRIHYQERTDDYYSEIDIMSHLGTHIEAPRHWNLKWKSVGEFPATHFMGRCVLLKLINIKPAAKITTRHLDTADRGRVREGDLVIIDTPYHQPPFSFPAKELRPFVNAEMAHWLVQKGVKTVGFADSVDIETQVEQFKEFHAVAMRRDVCFIEVLENLDLLQKEVFFLIALPLPFAELDSCPVRCVAIEGLEGYT